MKYTLILALAVSCFAQEVAISGDIPSPLNVTAADLSKMPRETVQIDEPDGSKSGYEGVPLQEVLKKAGLNFGSSMRGKALAAYVVASAHDGYQVVFSLGELDPDLGHAHVILADKRDGKPLFGYQGPLRLVVATDVHAARSVRMLEKLEIVKLRK